MAEAATVALLVAAMACTEAALALAAEAAMATMVAGVVADKAVVDQEVVLAARAEAAGRVLLLCQHSRRGRL